ncbi:DUF2845 domain-containing protein [Salinisphaera sp. SPP-AMP-43]|uniref:DUF2845 domain-containing protein n=1 Tax=Salinisphaera sp. SPP-AMP-43 TaxID=3121288 RepID=UPI003C6E8372
MRCSGQLVTEGDPAVSVWHACGEPSFRDPWWGNAPAQNPPMMEWTYNHGPQRLLEQVVFRNGRVVAIRSAGYGFINNGIPPSGSCNPSTIQPGMTKLQLLLSCGHPVQQTGWYIGSTIIREGGQAYFLHHAVQPVYRERWIYNFGARYLLREVRLENAEVVAVDTLGRGFDPR